MFWSTVALALSLGHAVVYAWTNFIPRNSFWDLLLPVTGVRLLAGSLSLLDALMVLIFYSLGWFLVAPVQLGWSPVAPVSLGWFLVASVQLGWSPVTPV